MQKNIYKQNINIYLAGPRGFCAGVDRAINMVEEALKKYGKDAKIVAIPDGPYTLAQIK